MAHDTETKAVEPTAVNLAQLLLRAFYWVDEGMQNGLKAKGWPNITRAQSMVFVNIGEGITRPSVIASKVGVTRQAVHQTIAELVNMGLLELRPDPNDKRAKIVGFTEKGVQIGRDTSLSMRRVEEELAARISAETIVALRHGLEKTWGKPVKFSD
jgi:DNA-binding MarR family transcriptional regulator